MAFSHENVSAKVAKTYTFFTEVISMRASATPTWMKRIQKTLASSDGSALVAMTAMAAGKQVFLHAITVITTVMRSMTSEDTKEQKAAVGGKKSPARAGDLRFSVAPPFIYSTQGRGAAHLNPGLGKRNSYRVAGGAYLPQWTNYTWSLGAYLPQWANYTWPLGA